MQLKLYLVKNKIRTQDFAARLGCSRTHLSEIITGKKKASLILAKFIQVLTNEEVNAEEILKEYKGESNRRGINGRC